MKKTILILILVSLAILVSGCGRRYYDSDVKKADINTVQVVAQR